MFGNLDWARRMSAWNRRVKVFHHRLFRRRWEKLAKEGVCDAPGGAEYRRVYKAWLRTSCAPLIPFIRAHANREPGKKG